MLHDSTCRTLTSLNLAHRAKCGFGRLFDKCKADRGTLWAQTLENTLGLAFVHSWGVLSNLGIKFIRLFSR